MLIAHRTYKLSKIFHEFNCYHLTVHLLLFTFLCESGNIIEIQLYLNRPGDLYSN